MRQSRRNVIFAHKTKGRSKKVKRVSTESKRTTMNPTAADVPLPAPDLFTKLPPIQDSLETGTSATQRATAEDCLPLHRGVIDLSTPLFDFSEKGVPRLRRDEHIAFLHDSLEEYPATFVTIDSSRPWFLYWALMGLTLLGEDVTGYRKR